MGQKGRVLELVLASDPKTTNTNWSSGPTELKEVSQQRATFNRMDICFIYLFYYVVVPAESRKGNWIP